MEKAEYIGNLFWRTRGRSWDFDFLITPESISVDACYRAYRAVMELMPLSEGQSGLSNQSFCFLRANGERECLSVGVVMDSRRDEFERPIRHVLGLLLPDKNDTSLIAPSHWYEAIWPVLDELFEDVFTLPEIPNIQAFRSTVSSKLREGLSSGRLEFGRSTVILPKRDIDIDLSVGLQSSDKSPDSIESRWFRLLSTPRLTGVGFLIVCAGALGIGSLKLARLPVIDTAVTDSSQCPDVRPLLNPGSNGSSEAPKTTVCAASENRCCQADADPKSVKLGHIAVP